MGPDPQAHPVVRTRVRVEGVVQGVGFRPFVYALATSRGLAGFVGNDGLGVFIEAEGTSEALAHLVDALSSAPPPLARIERVTSEPIPPTGGAGFAIVASGHAGPRAALVAPDTATCDDCLREMADPDDRRFGYAFINCTNCGPRYTIVRDLPYDRSGTTMAGFPLCDPCAREYEDPLDRRFHAQPVCCPACGPRLRLIDLAGGEPDGGASGTSASGTDPSGSDGSRTSASGGDPSGTGASGGGDPLALAVEILRAGRIVAVKGLGGFHLVVDAADEDAVRALRQRKHREERPLAIMVPDLEAARRLCLVGAVEEGLLQSSARPIVLLERCPDVGAGIAPSVAPGQRSLGLMLPYSPLHHLLLATYGGPLVMTSGNVSDEPIAHRDDDALSRLSGIADAFLTHDRPIHTRVDDSVVRSLSGRVLPIRRSRGFAPDPLTLPWTFPRPVLACGPELKNTFSLARDHHVFVSHHIGDLENYETLASFTEGVAHFRSLFAIDPQVVVHDLHPEYLSTKYAHDLAGDVLGDRVGLELVAVQHHHAHIASCLADNGVPGPVIGVAFDGLGMGDDGTLWGGEFLVADLATFTRAAHFDPVPMPGGALAIRQPWRMAAAYLDAAYEGHPPDLAIVEALRERQRGRWDQVLAAARAGVNAPLTSSAGRLFDAVAALVGVRDTVTYEGQAAIEFEQAADRREAGCYPMGVTDGTPLRIRGADAVRALLEDLAAGVPMATASARLHNGLAALTVGVCRRLRDLHGLSTVALSGGVFQNVLLTERCLSGLRDAGFTVLTHHRVPPNDGGISLGQAAICGARDRAAAG